MRLGIQVGASLVRGGYLSLGEALALLHSTPFRGVEVNQAHLTAFGDVEGFARRLSMFSLSRLVFTGELSFTLGRSMSSC